MHIKKTTPEDIEELMKLRLEMLRIVNKLDKNVQFEKTLIDTLREYFLHGDQTTVFAMEGDKIAGCASISYITIMPTFSHPTGKRAHLMNVYTRSEFRRKGVGKLMVEYLIEDAKQKGATEISLDATEMGHPLYKAIGFTENTEGMNLVL